MSDWHECPNAQECTEGNRFGKGCVVDPAQSAMGGKPWHECHCGVDSDGNPPNLRQVDEITRLRAENEKLRAALEPFACTCDRPNGAACSRSEVDCPFWNARATLEEK